MERKWKDLTQVLFALGITLLFFYMMAPYLVATLVGAVMAIICYPTFRNLRRKHLPKSLSAGIVTGLLSLCVLVPVLLVLYLGSLKILRLISQFELPEDRAELLANDWILDLIDRVHGWVSVDPEWLQNQAIPLFQGLGAKLSKIVAGTLAGMPALLVGFVVVILSVYFLLLDGERFLIFLSRLSPLSHRRSKELFNSFQSSCRGVVLGLFSSALVQGFLMMVFFFLTGLPNAILAGMLGVGMGMVPVVGTAPLWGGAVIYLFYKGLLVKGIVMLVGGILISTSDNVVRAVIMQEQGDMHPFIALISVFGAVNLVGAAGIFLGPIIAAVFISFLKNRLSRDGQFRLTSLQTAKAS